MTSHIGQLLLALALFCSLTLAILPWLTKLRTRPSAGNLRLLLPLVYGGGLSILLTFAWLILAHARSDFSLLNVYLHSNTAKPMIYKITGTWGNHEGSMLLWVSAIALFTAAFAKWNRFPPAVTLPALAIQHAIIAGFLLFILLTSDPFVALSPVPENGMGLNPLLQDIGLAIHPPVLYLGYVGFSISLSVAVALLLCGSFTRAEAMALKPWVMLSWSFLTVGVGLGSWWAYRELGWGGFWFWDPVENASLMPWLAATALLHSLLLVEKREALKGWTLLLAILTFSLSLLGTFLVRSGVLTSVHAFANDPERGIYILIFLTLVVGFSLTVYGLRVHRVVSDVSIEPFSRETFLLLGNLLLIVACATIVIGTLYPLLVEMISGTSLSVGAPYYYSTFNTLVIPLLALAALAPLVKWKKDAPRTLAEPVSVWPFVVSAVGTGCIFWALPRTSPLAYAALFVGFWLFFATVSYALKKAQYSPRKLGGFSLHAYALISAHIGVAVLAISISAASSWNIEKEKALLPGEHIVLAGYDVTFENLRYYVGKNYLSRVGDFSVSKNGQDITVLKPELRIYPIEAAQTTEAAIYSTPLADLYIAIGELDSAKHLATRVYYKPLVNGIWFGCLLMGLGGMLGAVYAFRKKL